jgi:hypothetical protein
MGAGGSSPGVKWQEHESDHVLLSRAEVKNAWNFTLTAVYQLHA